MATEFAPAKVNLTLHVTGQREDGYHLLDSLVMFADVGDRLDIFSANTLSLTVEGPMADGVPADTANSIMKCAQLFKPQEDGAAFLLTKNLPSSAGIGGGSADAAAAFRGLLDHWGPQAPETLFDKGLDPEQMTEDEKSAISAQLKNLGADVPVCLFSQTARMQGIGEKITFYRKLPSIYAVLVNPGIAVSTPAVFKELKSKKNGPMPTPPEQFGRVQELISWVADRRNDLQRPAVTLFPEIGYVLRALEFSNGCKLSRMSGSGATCFGLYENERFAQAAATRLSQLHPTWWVKSCVLGG